MNTIDTPKIDIIVTRHPHLVTVMRERGIVDENTPVMEHASAADVRGKHVAGVLPHHLSSLAASVTEIPMRWTFADRQALQRGDLGLEATRRAAGSPVSYVVRRPLGGQIHHERPRWLAWAAATRYVEERGCCHGAGPHVGAPAEVDGHRVFMVWDAEQSASAQVMQHRGLWRPMCRGPWLDGYGREVSH